MPSYIAFFGLIALSACSSWYDPMIESCTDPNVDAGPVAVSDDTPLGSVSDWHVRLTSTTRQVVVVDSSDAALVGDTMSMSFDLSAPVIRAGQS